MIPTRKATISMLRKGPTTSKVLVTMLASDNIFQRFDWESLDHRFGWLCRHANSLSEHCSDTSFPGWLDTGLDSAHAWNDECSHAFHLLRCNTRESGYGFCNLTSLQFGSCPQCISQIRLRHCFTRRPRLH